MTAQVHLLAKTYQGQRTLDVENEAIEMTGSYNMETG